MSATSVSENHLGAVLPYRSPKAREESTAWLGMIIFLASWAMMFACLFFAYGYLRAKLPSWPPEGLPKLPLALPAGNTLVLLASSAALQLGLTRIKKGKPNQLAILSLVALALGVVFLVLQILLWQSLTAKGMTPSNGGPYASVFYGLTWFHALHVVVGFFGLARLAYGAFRNEFHAAKHLPVRLWTMYWHFVGVVWALMFVTIFLL